MDWTICSTAAAEYKILAVKDAFRPINVRHATTSAQFQKNSHLDPTSEVLSLLLPLSLSSSPQITNRYPITILPKRHTSQLQHNIVDFNMPMAIAVL